MPFRRFSPDQALWVTRWGTMTALVWAKSAENAEARARRRVFNPRASIADVLAVPLLIEGEMYVRPATLADVETWHACGGPPIEWAEPENAGA